MDAALDEENEAAAPARRFQIARLTWREELAHFRGVLRNYADASLVLHRRLGEVIHVRFPDPAVSLVHPRHNRRVLRSHVLNYPKSPEYEVLRPLLGDGIFVSDGEVWTRQRRILAPEFRAAVAPRFIPVIAADVEALFRERWEPSVGGPPRDLSDDLMRLTLWVVGDAIFAQDFRGSADAVGHALEVVLTHATRLMLSGGLYKAWMPTPGNRRARRAERELDAIVERLIVDARAALDPSGQDVLTRLLKAKDADGRPAMSDRQLRDEIKSLVLAGHETTSLALAWSLYLLGDHPEVHRRLVEEVDAVLGGRTPTADDVPRLVYTRMVFLEAMRLYPPVPLVPRILREADEFDGIRLEAGTKITLLPYVTHRLAEFWPRPDEFDPERFAPGRIDAIEPYSYLPFLLGRRACLGEHFAMLEGIVALAMIVDRYTLTRADRAPIATRPISTLRMARPLRMRVERRRRG
ncbi:MAG: cytochrome P450 [Nannocystaceae bacterium]